MLINQTKYYRKNWNRHFEIRCKKLIEKPITIPDEKKTEINMKILKDYYDSLNHFLEKSNY
jgi:hypothetical protein